MTRWLLVLAACGSSSRPQPDPAPSNPAPAAAPKPSQERRCLPVVAKDCGCVYSCGVGVRTGDGWTVTHAFWKDATLKAKIDRWCVDGRCTDAFHAEIVCDGICLPKPADASCHFDGDTCVGATPD